MKVLTHPGHGDSKSQSPTIQRLEILSYAVPSCTVSHHHFDPDWTVSTAVGWIAITFCSDIHRSQRKSPADFIDPLTFPPVFPLAITVLMYLMWYLDIDGFAKKKKNFFANIHASQSINSNDFGTRDCSSWAIMKFWFRVKCLDNHWAPSGQKSLVRPVLQNCPNLQLSIINCVPWKTVSSNVNATCS